MVPPTCRLIVSWPLVPRARTTIVLLPLLDEEELELLLEVEEVLDDELELELDVEVLLDDELELEEVLLEVELLLEVPLPTQDGAMKLPSWLPWKPKTLLAVAPGAGSCQEQQLVNWKLVPGLVPVRLPTFHWLVTVTCSGKFRVTVQLASAVVPVLVTDTSSWKKVPPVLEGVAVQLCAANACPFDNRPSIRPDSSTHSLK